MSAMFPWIGRWLMAVGAIHCSLGLVVFADPLIEIAKDGLWNAVEGYRGRPLAFWFEFAGLLLILFGAMLSWIEKRSARLPGFLGYGFLLLTVIAILTMPYGGGWLFVPPTLGMLMKSDRFGRRPSV